MWSTPSRRHLLASRQDDHLVFAKEKKKKVNNIIEMNWLLWDPFVSINLEGVVGYVLITTRHLQRDICMSSWPQVMWCSPQAGAASSEGSPQFDSISQLFATRAVAQAQAGAQRQSVERLAPQALLDWHPMRLSNNSWQSQCKGECLWRDSTVIWKGQQKKRRRNCKTLRCLLTSLISFSGALQWTLSPRACQAHSSWVKWTLLWYPHWTFTSIK